MASYKGCRFEGSALEGPLEGGYVGSSGEEN